MVVGCETMQLTPMATRLTRKNEGLNGTNLEHSNAAKRCQSRLEFIKLYIDSHVGTMMMMMVKTSFLPLMIQRCIMW